MGADTVFVCAGDSIELSVQDVPIGYGYLWNRTDTTPTPLGESRRMEYFNRK
ncbi:MAG: hypothetical protein IPO21_01290 [Bacteroidales bacterium]|nr:hypothetical protein [Bacteroidales bacterium]